MNVASTLRNIQRDSGPIYQAAFSYRQTSILVAATILVAVFLPAFVRFAWSIASDSRVVADISLLLVPTTLFGTFAFAGGLLLFRYITSFSIFLTIDREGVRYGDRHVPWTDVRSFIGRRGRRSRVFQLVLRERGQLISGRRLETSDGLTEVELTELMATLELVIAPSYAHLSFRPSR